MIKFKIYIFSILISCFCFLGASLQDVQIFHSQDRKQLGVSLKESMFQAKNSLLIFTFSLSDPEVIQILNQKALEGIKVTVVIDRAHLGEILNHRTPQIEIVTRVTGEGHLHHKILVIDEEEIWMGSANFTKAAYTSQENLMVRFHSPELAKYLHHEADVFRKIAVRSEHGPLPISLLNQAIYFCLLPHDGFPPKKIEKGINEFSKQFLIEKINRATSTLQIAMMVWTNNDLTNAVIQAHRRGVKVQVVAADWEGNFPKLLAAGIEVKVNPQLGLMHNKLMCIDHHLLVNGSANWSQSSFTRSDESFIIVEPLTLEQLVIFDQYWNYLVGENP